MEPTSNQLFKKSIKSGPLSHRVMDEIKSALLNNSLHPGDRLPTETEMSDSLGVGKSSVREAIKMLEILGVVETRQGDGTFITNKQIEQHVNPLVYQLILLQGTNAQIMELRAMFEPAFCKLAVLNVTDEDILNIRKVHKTFCEKVSNGTQQADDDLAFHKAILQATHNPYVIRIGETVMQLFSATIEKSMKRIPERAVADHEAILAAFLSRDEGLLQNTLMASFDGWMSMMDEKV